MHTFCCWGSPQRSRWSQGVSFNAFAKETLWHGPHLRISDCFPLDMQTSGEPHMQMQPQCRKHVAVCKEASACLACMRQCCLQKSGENSRTDFTELLCAVRVSPTNSAGSHLNTYFLGMSSFPSVTREWKLWVCESVCVWGERYKNDVT